MSVVAEIASNEIKQARLLADVAVGRHSVVLLHPSRVEELVQRLGTLEFIVCLLDQA